MARDPYELCPCGSGKKFKFCCIDLSDDIDRVMAMQNKDQERQAFQYLNRLLADHPQNPWVRTTHAAMLMAQGEFAEARDALREFTEANPDHPFGLAIMASASVATDGYRASRRVIHRAFQKASGVLPDFVGRLALGISELMLRQGCPMACRQFMTLGLRLSSEEHRQQIFMRLLELDGDQDIPFPLRSVHELSPRPGCLSEDEQKEFVRAVRLTEIGCFGPAAKLFTRLTEQHPDVGALHYNIGICRAWDGELEPAAAALHRAAELIEDEPLAVECETLAQLLDVDLTDDVIPYLEHRWSVESLSKTLTVLDEHPHFHRLPDDDQDPRVVASYELTDRPIDEQASVADWSVADVPLTIGHIAFIDADPGKDEPAEAYLSALEGDESEQSRKLVGDLEGAGLKELESLTSEADRAYVPREMRELQWSWRFPAGTSGQLRRQLEQEQWNKTAFEVWPQLHQAALGDRSPVEAAGDPECRVKVLAAVNALDAFCNRSGFLLDLDRLYKQLNIEPLATIAPADDLRVGGLSSLQLLRLPVEDLSDEQLRDTVNRALLVFHRRFLQRVLLEVTRRPDCMSAVNPQRVYRTLTDLALSELDREAALNWIQQGTDSVQQDEKTFENKLSWKIRELTVRMETPDEPQTKQLVDELWNYYGTKLPGLKENLQRFLEAYNYPVPGGGIVTAGEAVGGSPSDAGVWTPDAPPESSEGGPSKLWIPGQ